MKVYTIIFSVICLLSSVSGRYTNKSDPAQVSLKRLLQFYRSQGDSGPASAETPELLSSELDFPPDPNSGTFRIDLSNTFADDMIPFAESVPIGSAEPPPPKSSTSTTADPSENLDVAIPSTFVVASHSDDSDSGIGSSTTTTTETVIAPEVDTDTVNHNPEEAENEATTMFPEQKMRDMTSSFIKHQVHAMETGNDDDVTQEDEDEDDDDDHCKEGQTKKIPCNNACVCVDGAFFCSNRKCDDDKSPVTQIHMKSPTTKPDAQKKTWGTRKKFPVNETMPTCSTGMTKSVDCNRCICVMGKWACTKRGCIALTLREKASYTDGVSIYNQVETLVENKDIDEDCAESGTRQLGCNQCVCHLNSWSCSNMPCGPTPPPKPTPEILEACRKDGDVKSRDCNLCKCIRGIWICSRNNCNSFENNDDAIPGFRTGSKFKYSIVQKAQN